MHPSTDAKFLIGSWKAACMCINTCVLIHTHTLCCLRAIVKMTELKSPKIVLASLMMPIHKQVCLSNLHAKSCHRWPKENTSFIIIQLQSSGSCSWQFSASLPCCLSRTERQTEAHRRVWIKGKTLKPNMWEVMLLKKLAIPLMVNFFKLFWHYLMF